MTFGRNSCCILFILLLLSACNPQPSAQKTKISKPTVLLEIDTSILLDAVFQGQYNQYWQRRFLFGGYQGVTLVARNDSFYTWSAGNADSGVLLQSHMPMQIASITKTFTATAVMMLIQDKKLALTDTLRKFFPELPYYNVTIEQMLCHTSGLPEYSYFTELYWHDSMGSIQNQDVINLMAIHKEAAYYRPGHHHRYCNTNFLLLASVIEKVSKMGYPEFLKSRIFDPLGMKSTFVWTKELPWEKLKVKGHYGNGKRFAWHYQDGTYGDKNIISTAWDLFRFYKGLQNNLILKQKHKENMFKTRIKGARRGTDYALGWRKRTVNGEEWMFHSGWWHGFRTNFYFSLKDNKCAVTLSNKLSGGFIPGVLITSMFDAEEWTHMLKSRGYQKMLEGSDTED